MRSLRGRLSLVIGLLIAIVLVVSGFLISDYAENIAREELDDRLQRTALLFEATAVDAFSNAIPEQSQSLDDVLNATNSSLRLLLRDQVIFEAGNDLLDGIAPKRGLHTVGDLRVLVVPLKDVGLGELAKLEVASSLDTIDKRRSDLDKRLLRLGIGALVAALLGTFLVTSGVLNPLRRLRRTAGDVADESDLSVRVSETDGPSEVRDLATSLNAMLARLSASTEARERALAATQRFTLDAGHELRTPLTTVQATLSALYRHPDVETEQRTAMLGDALAEQRRLVDLLDGLQALARGDASQRQYSDVDLADVTSTVVADARRRHTGVTVDVDLPEAAVTVRGWEEGLRMMVGNLVDNAVHHGEGRVRVTLTDAPIVLTVDDDGPGIPEDDRERVFEPFERLDEAVERAGSGLGLALVAQQVRDHGATIAVEDSPLGGARFVVAFQTPLRTP